MPTLPNEQGVGVELNQRSAPVPAQLVMRPSRFPHLWEAAVLPAFSKSPLRSEEARPTQAVVQR